LVKVASAKKLVLAGVLLWAGAVLVGLPREGYPRRRRSRLAPAPGPLPIREPAEPAESEPAEPDPTPKPPASSARPARPVRLLARAFSLLSKLMLGAAGVGVAFTVVGSLTGAWGLVPILSGSMRPGIQPGDAVLVAPEPLSAVRPGQVLVIQPPGLGGATVAHRVVSVTRGPGGPVIRTRGDANNVVDPWKAQLGGTRAWRARAVIPDLGYLSVIEHNRRWRLGIEVVLLATGLGMALSVIWGRSRDRTKVVTAGRPPVPACL
jgi:signal peptidase I